jgi:predicted alpha/beta superfamily hydrolase
MNEQVIIGIDNTDGRIFEYTYSVDPQDGGGGADLYLDFIEQTILPLTLPMFRLKSVAQGLELGMMGSSLGGLLSCYAGWTRPLYRKVGCMSSSFWWNSQDFNTTIMDSPTRHPTKQNVPLIYVDCGTDELAIGADTKTTMSKHLSHRTSVSAHDDVQDDPTIYGSTQVVYHHMQHYPVLVEGQNLFYYLAQGAGHNEASWGQRVSIPLEILYSNGTSHQV